MRTSAVLATVLTLAACSEELPEDTTPPEPPRVAPVFDLTGFRAEITPPTRGPGGETIPGRTVWVLETPQSGGGVTVNPARSIQMRTTSNFAEGGASGTCGGATISAPVEITNFYPEKLVNLYIAFDWTSPNPSSHAICTSETAPAAIGYTTPTAPTGALGYLRYTTGSTPVARSTMAASDPLGTCPTCVAAGGSLSDTWTFGFGVNETFNVHGRVYSQFYPEPPTVISPTLRFGTHEQLPINMWVYDTQFSDAEPWVTQIQLDVCEGTLSGCTGPVSTKVVNYDLRVSANNHTNYTITSTDLAPEIVLVPGTTYLMQAWGLFYPNGAGGTPTGTQYAGSVPLSVSFTHVGTPTMVSLADGEGFGDGDSLVWTVDSPDPARATATGASIWRSPGVFEICGVAKPATTDTACNTTNASATTLYWAYDPSTGRYNRFITPSLAGSVYTYTFLPNYTTWTTTYNASTNPYPRPAPGTVGWWRVRNQYLTYDRNGPWVEARKIVFGDKPTGLTNAGATLSFAHTGENSTTAQVQLCGSSADCSTADTPVAATGGPTAYTYDSTGTGRPFYWRARAIYGAEYGPWSTISQATP